MPLSQSGKKLLPIRTVHFTGYGYLKAFLVVIGAAAFMLLLLCMFLNAIAERVGL